MITGLLIAGILVVVLLVVFTISRFRLCPPNQVLVVYGIAGDKDKPAKCCHGGGTFVWPLLQNSTTLPLRPFTIDVDLNEALSKNSIRVDVPSAFTIAIDPKTDMIDRAALRLLHMDEATIKNQTREIIIGQMRAVIASLTIEQINSDRDAFLDSIQTHVTTEIAKLGLCLINANIVNIVDESGIIQAVGRKAAAEAVQQAAIDVATQEQKGATGVAEQNKMQKISVAERNSETAVGTANANKAQSIGVAEAEKETALAVADQQAQKAEGESQARIKIAKASEASQVAEANATTAILKAQKEAETAKLTKDEIVREEVNQAKVKVIAEANALKIMIEAKANADAILLAKTAEAEGNKKILEAKASGFQSIVDSCGGDSTQAISYLIMEYMPELAKTQVEALKNIKIDKNIMISNGGEKEGKGGLLSNLTKDIVNCIPQLNETMGALGIKMPSMFGKLVGDEANKSSNAKVVEAIEAPKSDVRKAHTVFKDKD